MRRSLILALTAAVLATAAFPAVAAAAPGSDRAPALSTTAPDTGKVCDINWRRSVRAMKRLIRCAAVHFDVPGGAHKAIDVAECESNFNPDAWNASGCAGYGCGGVFQHHMRYWAGRAQQYGFPGASVFNGRANTFVSMQMVRAAGNWNDWSCA